MKSKVIETTILISGASGFLGKELINQLKNFENIKVLALTSQKENLEKYTSLMDNITVINNCDMSIELSKSKEIDVLINCAFARTSNGAELADSLDYNLKLVNKAVSIGVRSIVNISSQSVYNSNRILPADEISEIEPETLYGLAKYANELLVSSICKGNDIYYTHIRLASLIGVNFNARLINRMVINALDHNHLRVYGGQQIISYLGVKDAALGIITLSLTDSAKWDKIYNLGSNENYSLVDVAGIVKSEVEKYTSKIISISLEESSSQMNISLNSRKFFDCFSWQPKEKLDLIIADIVKNLST